MRGKLRNRSSLLLPKEHGAYAQLAFPLTTGLALTPPSPAALALGASAVCLFLANEPLSILLKTRGARLKEQQGARARVRAGILLGSGSAFGALGLAMGWPAVWPLVLVPALAGLLLVPMALTGRQKSLPGEFLVLTVFSTLVPPLAVASGADPIRPVLAAGVWWISFGLGTVEVHAVKARIRKTARSQWTRWASPLAAGATVAAAMWVALGQAGPLLRGAAQASSGFPGPFAGSVWASELPRLLPPAAAALLPPALAIFVLSLIRVHPRHLKRVGWTLVAVNFLTLILLLQG